MDFVLFLEGESAAFSWWCSLDSDWDISVSCLLKDHALKRGCSIGFQGLVFSRVPLFAPCVAQRGAVLPVKRWTWVFLEGLERRDWRREDASVPPDGLH